MFLTRSICFPLYDITVLQHCTHTVQIEYILLGKNLQIYVNDQPHALAISPPGKAPVPSWMGPTSSRDWDANHDSPSPQPIHYTHYTTPVTAISDKYRSSSSAILL